MTSPVPATSSPAPIKSAPSTPRKSGSSIADGRFDLTPRSKVKALLAGFDGSDDEDVGYIPRAGAEASRPESTRGWIGKGKDGDGDEDMNINGDEEDEDEEIVVGRRSRGLVGGIEVDDNEEEDDDDDEVLAAILRKPRGIAGRMEVDNPSSDNNDIDEDKSTPIKRNRLRKVASPKSKMRKDPFSQKDSDDSDSAEKRSKSPPQSKSPASANTEDEYDPTLAHSATANGNNINDDDDDDELPANLLANPRLAALVAAKRKERKEKEATETAKVAEHRARAAGLDDDTDDESDDSAGTRALEASQMQPRQRRSAGKKAMAEIARETQRMARGMQLSHEVRTKKKIGKEELFAKFGFRQPKAESTPVVKVGKKKDSTPPEIQNGSGNVVNIAEKELPKVSTSESLLSAFGLAPDPSTTATSTSTDTKSEKTTPPPPTRLDKGKDRAIDPPTPKQKIKKEFKLPPVKVDFSKHPPNNNTPITVGSDGDSDIEIVDPTALTTQQKQPNSKYAVLQARKLAFLEAQQKEKKAREQAQKDAAILDLRRRSGNTSNLLNKSPKPAFKGSKMNPKQFTATLLQQSRQQALKDREEKIAELKAKGVIIPTAEERMKDAVSVEEQIEKARLEAARIKKREKKERKLEAIRKGEVVPDDTDDEDEEMRVRESGDEDEEGDADWVEEEGQEGLYELSGEEEGDILGSGDGDEGESDSGVDDFSDEEGKEEDVDLLDRGEGAKACSAFITDEAGEDEDEDEEDEDNEQLNTVATKRRKPRRKPRIIDDSDEDNNDSDAMDIDPSTPAKSGKPLSGFAWMNSEAPLGLTQMFQGTIAESLREPLSPGNKPKSKNPFAAFPDFGGDTDPMGLTQMFESTIADPVSKPKSNNPFAAFPGLNVAMDAPLGLTQMFAGTIADDSQDSEPFTLSGSTPTKKSRLDVLRKPPVNPLANSQAPVRFVAAQEEEEGEEVIKETQIDTDTDMHVDLAYEQSPTPRNRSDDEETQVGGQSVEKIQASFPLVDLKYSQSQIYTEEDSYNTAFTATQLSQFPNPTPDTGFLDFQDSYSVHGVKRFDTPGPTQTKATQATVIERAATPTQPLPPVLGRKKNRRLRRAADRASESGAEDRVSESSADEQANIFSIMKKAARAEKRRVAQEEFNKKTSGAKNMVHEQAEESEDEWAGIGGVDEVEDDEDEEKVRQEMGEMIDDEEKNIDRSKIEAYHAEREREEDAKNVTRLFKDLQSGGLRRKRGIGGAGFDLSDSEDEIERKRAVKRRNEARLRKLLLEDTNISKIAENPKRMAFLECLQDNDKDDTMNFLDQVEDDEASQALDTPIGEKERQGTTEGHYAHPARKLQREDSSAQRSDSDTFTTGPKLPHSRISRGAAGRGGGRRSKNPGLAEIREQLSFLVDEEKFDVDFSDDSDADDIFAGVDEGGDGNGLIGAPDTTGENDINITTTTITSANTSTTTPGHLHPRRTNRTSTVIDRISLKRIATLESASHSSTTKLAFHAATGDDDIPVAFRIPGLLRRATTGSSNNSQLSIESNGGTTSDAGATSGPAGAMKKSGAKGSSSISYHQREREKERKKEVRVGKEDERRRGKMEEEHRRREEQVRRAAAAGGDGAASSGRKGGGKKVLGVVGILGAGQFS